MKIAAVGTFEWNTDAERPGQAGHEVERRNCGAPQPLVAFVTFYRGQVKAFEPDVRAAFITRGIRLPAFAGLRRGLAVARYARGGG
jgi:hypothetical protein